MEQFQHNLFDGHNHPSRLLVETQWSQPGSGIEQVIVRTSAVLVVAHNLDSSVALAAANNILEWLDPAALVVLAVDHETEDFAASGAVGSIHYVLAARSRPEFGPFERCHRFESPYAVNRHRAK